VTVRPGLSDLRDTTTGAAHEPWLVGLALVALAGAGALLATRGLPRRLLGVLLVAIGAGIVVGAIIGRIGLDPGTAGAAAVSWPIACGFGGAAVVVGGLVAARHGARWPVMGTRYERRTVASPSPRPGGESGPSATAGRTTDAASTDAGPIDAGPIDTHAAWDALDRGEDPTTH
jgi:hypothetical protein